MNKSLQTYLIMADKATKFIEPVHALDEREYIPLILAAHSYQISLNKRLDDVNFFKNEEEKNAFLEKTKEMEVLVNLVNNMDKEKFDITVKTLFDVGVNKKFLKSHIKYDYCLKKTFKANSQILKIFSSKYLYKKFVKEKYDVVISYLEGPTSRIISGCNDPNTKKICWIHSIIRNLVAFSATGKNTTFPPEI